MPLSPEIQALLAQVGAQPPQLPQPFEPRATLPQPNAPWEMAFDPGTDIGTPNAPEPINYGFGDNFALALQQAMSQLPQVRGFAGSALRGAAQGFSNTRVNSIAKREAAQAEQVKQQEEERARINAAAKTMSDRRWQMQREAQKAAADKSMENYKASLQARRDKAQNQFEREQLDRQLASLEKRARIAASAKGSAGQRIVMPTAGEREKVALDNAMLDSVMKIQGRYKDNFSGPMNRALNLGKDTTGAFLQEGEADFKAALAQYENALINALSGAAVSDQEYQRLKRQSPQTTDPPKVFRAKIRQTIDFIRAKAEQRRKVMEQSGVDISRLDPLPGMAPAPAPPADTPPEDQGSMDAAWQEVNDLEWTGPNGR